MRYNLSIIIPFYNAEKYLKSCLESVILNNTKDIEYILINDGSTDQSLEICKNYKGNPDVKIKTVKNGGVSNARNLGIKMARGKFIMFVDADDTLLNGWRKNIKKYFKAGNDLVIFSSKYDGAKYSKTNLLRACLGFSGTKLDSCSIMSPVSRLYRRDFLIKQKLAFYSEIINGEDMLFNLRAILATDKIAMDKNGFYFYRKNPTSATQTFNKKIITANRKFEQRLAKIVNGSSYQKDLCDTMSLSNANGLYVVANNLVKFNSPDAVKIMKGILAQHDTEALLSAIAKNKTTINGYHFMVIRKMLNGKIRIALLLIRAKQFIVRLRKSKSEGNII